MVKYGYKEVAYMREKIIQEIKKLYDEGSDILSLFIEDKDEKEKIINQRKYQVWYTKASLVVKNLLPSRFREFTECYTIEKRKDLSLMNYTISDYFRNLILTQESILFFEPKPVAIERMATQLDIIDSLSKNITNILVNIISNIELEIMDNELESAKLLLKGKFVRSAGAICGVILEKQFSVITKNHALDIRKKNPCINDYNDLFKEQDIYDIVTWRFIQRLADIRNLCDHNKDREPTYDEVEELINGTDKVIKTIF